jgi:hypothetical protein
MGDTQLRVGDLGLEPRLSRGLSPAALPIGIAALNLFPHLLQEVTLVELTSPQVLHHHINAILFPRNIIW